ncbi:MAG: hypothetical protein ACC661_03060 [Verrucomicrobiales bacterium]
MTKIFLVLSAVVLAATALFAVLNRNYFIGERASKDKAHEDWKVAARALEEEDGKLKDEQEKLKTVKDQRDEADANLTLANEKLMQKEKGVKELQAALDEERLKLKEFKVVLEKFEGKSVEELKDKQEGLAKNLADLGGERDALEQKRKDVNAGIEGQEKAVENHKKKQLERSAAIARNAFEATITAVNRDWGFVIIDAGKNRGVTAGSELLVSTPSGQRVGRLNIVSIEPTVTVANIDQDSITGGAPIQPGYRVLYDEVAE